MEQSSPDKSGKRGGRGRFPDVPPPNPPRNLPNLSRETFLENRIDLLVDDNLRLLDEVVSYEVNQRSRAQQTAATDFQNPREARAVTTNDRLQYELGLAHRKIMELEEEVEKEVSKEVQEEEKLHEKELEDEEVARLKNELRTMEAMFQGQIGELKTKNGKLEQQVKDAEATAEETVGQMKNMIEKENHRIAKLRVENGSKNREVAMLKEENMHLKASRVNEAELESGRLKLQRAQKQLEADRKALDDQRRQLEEEKKQTSMVANQQMAAKKAKLDADKKSKNGEDQTNVGGRNPRKPGQR